MRVSLMLISCAVLSAFSTVIRAQETGDVRQGLQFAQTYCSECHAVAPGDTTSPVPGVASFEEISNTPGMTGMALAVWFRTSHPTMPNFILEPDDEADLIAYLLSLKERQS